MAGRPKGSQSRKYAVSSAISKRYGSIEAFVIKVLKDIESLGDEDKVAAIGHFLKLFPYIAVTADKINDADDNNKRPIVINNILKSEDVKEALKDPREK